MFVLIKINHHLNIYIDLEVFHWKEYLLWFVCACFFVGDGGKYVRRWLIKAWAWLRTNTNKDLYPGLEI